MSTSRDHLHFHSTTSSPPRHLSDPNSLSQVMSSYMVPVIYQQQQQLLALDEVSLEALDAACAQVFRIYDKERRAETAKRRNERKRKISELKKSDRFGQAKLADVKQAKGYKAPTQHDNHIMELGKLFGEFGLSLDNYQPDGGHFYIDRGLIHYFFTAGQYITIQSIIRSLSRSTVPLEHVKDIRDIWHETLYIIEINRRQLEGRGSALTSVMKYRLRRREPCPVGGEPENWKYEIYSDALKLFMAQYEKNEKPSRMDKELLRQQTGYEIEKINNWFKNRRQRGKKMRACHRNSVSSTQSTESPSSQSAQSQEHQLVSTCEQVIQQVEYVPPQQPLQPHPMNAPYLIQPIYYMEQPEEQKCQLVTASVEPNDNGYEMLTNQESIDLVKQEYQIEPNYYYDSPICEENMIEMFCHDIDFNEIDSEVMSLLAR